MVSFGPRDEQNISKAHMLERHYLPRDIVLMDFVLFVFQRALKDCYNISSRECFLNNIFFSYVILQVLEFGMKPILCIGETQEEYDLGITEEVCAMQVSKDLAGVSKKDLANVVLAYEPVWAIGTGLVCDSDQANEVHKFIRTVLEKMYDKEAAQAMRIQYGGSVTPESVDGLMAKSDIDGCLVGGASLFADKFARICNFESSS